MSGWHLTASPACPSASWLNVPVLGEDEGAGLEALAALAAVLEGVVLGVEDERPGEDGPEDRVAQP